MYLYSLWSGLLLIDSLTRDTNSQAELWRRIPKKDILKSKHKFSTTNFIKVFNPSIKGRLIKYEFACRGKKSKSIIDETNAKKVWNRALNKQRIIHIHCQFLHLKKHKNARLSTRDRLNTFTTNHQQNYNK